MIKSRPFCKRLTITQKVSTSLWQLSWKIRVATLTLRTPLRQGWTSKWKSLISDEPLKSFRKWATALRTLRKSWNYSRSEKQRSLETNLTLLSPFRSKIWWSTNLSASKYLVKPAFKWEAWRLAGQVFPTLQISLLWASLASSVGTTPPKPKTVDKSDKRH